MWWWWMFWRRPVYTILWSQSHASAAEAARSLQLQIRGAGGEILGIAASAMCCAGEDGAAGAEWNLYALRRT